MIGHDMGLMAQFASRIGIMYGGKIVEIGPGFKHLPRIRETPLHQTPNLQPPRHPQQTPTCRHPWPTAVTPKRPPPGCVFHTRCPGGHGDLSCKKYR